VCVRGWGGVGRGTRVWEDRRIGAAVVRQRESSSGAVSSIECHYHYDDFD
jgi:hypothetical protein